MLRVGRRLPRLIEQQINLGEREAGERVAAMWIAGAVDRW